MTTFLALYRGATIGEAQLLAVSVEPNIVGYVASHLLDECNTRRSDDAVLGALHAGRERALQIVAADTAPDDRRGSE